MKTPSPLLKRTNSAGSTRNGSSDNTSSSADECCSEVDDNSPLGSSKRMRLSVPDRLGRECLKGYNAVHDALDYASAISQAAILTYSIWSAFSTEEMQELLTELCNVKKFYYANTKPTGDGDGGVTHGQVIWRVDELFEYADTKNLNDIPMIRKFLKLTVEEAKVEGCRPCFFRSIIRIYCPDAGDGLQHVDSGVRAARLVAQCSFSRQANHLLQFFLGKSGSKKIFHAITTGTEAFGMGKVLSGTEPLDTGVRVSHKASVTGWCITHVRDWAEVDYDALSLFYKSKKTIDSAIADITPPQELVSLSTAADETGGCAFGPCSRSKR